MKNSKLLLVLVNLILVGVAYFFLLDTFGKYSLWIHLGVGIVVIPVLFNLIMDLLTDHKAEEEKLRQSFFEELYVDIFGELPDKK